MITQSEARIRELEAMLNEQQSHLGDVRADNLQLTKRIRELEAALTKIASPGEGGRPGPDLHECIRIARAALAPKEEKT